MAHEKWVRSVKPTSHFVTSYGVEWGIFSDRLSPWHDILMCKPCSPVLRMFNLVQELLKQFYSAIVESVLCTSITVWFSSATKSDLRRLTMEGSPDCWAKHWYNPPHSQRTVLIQDEQKGWQNPSGALTSNPSLSCCCLVDDTELWAPERLDTETVSSLTLRQFI